MTGSDRRIEAVLFDLDDTLIDWARPAANREDYYRPRIQKVRDYLVDAGHYLPPGDEFFGLIDLAIMATWDEAKKTLVMRSLGDVFHFVFTSLGLAVEQIDMDEVLRVFDWGPWPGVVVFPDAIPVLSELRRQGYKIGLLTNAYLPMWMRDVELQAYQLLDYLDARVTAADVGYIKPHPLIYQCLLDQLGIPAGKAVFVGDRPRNDIAGANAAGLISVLISPPHLNRELEGVVPDFTITTLTELFPILESLEMEGVYG